MKKGIRILGIGKVGAKILNTGIMFENSEVSFSIIDTEKDSLKMSNSDQNLQVSKLFTNYLAGTGATIIDEITIIKTQNQIKNLIYDYNPVVIVTGLESSSSSVLAATVSSIASKLSKTVICLVVKPLLDINSMNLRIYKENTVILEKSSVSVFMIDNSVQEINAGKQTPFVNDIAGVINFCGNKLQNKGLSLLETGILYPEYVSIINKILIAMCSLDLNDDEQSIDINLITGVYAEAGVIKKSFKKLTENYNE
ncbi:MAG: hypothetical protein IAE91_11180 [Ignavibacteriaceae bacterium]|nr:hypothetical protein [Ignavibacteriaceae bacterium]